MECSARTHNWYFVRRSKCVPYTLLLQTDYAFCIVCRTSVHYLCLIVLYSWTITILKRDKTVLMVKALKATNFINRHQTNHVNIVPTTLPSQQKQESLELKEHHTGQLNNCYDDPFNWFHQHYTQLFGINTALLQSSL